MQTPALIRRNSPPPRLTRHGSVRVATAVALASLIASGCSRATRYGPGLAVGDVVRLERTDGVGAQGPVTARTDSTLEIGTGTAATPVATNLRSIRWLERYEGESRHGAAGMVFGTFAGFAIGTVVSQSRHKDNTSSGELNVEVDSAIPVSILAGLVLGYVVGESIVTEHWERVPGFEVKPTQGGARAATIWGF